MARSALQIGFVELGDLGAKQTGAGSFRNYDVVFSLVVCVMLVAANSASNANNDD